MSLESALEVLLRLPEYSNDSSCRQRNAGIGGSMVEFSPPTRETRVRFPANARWFARVHSFGAFLYFYCAKYTAQAKCGRLGILVAAAVNCGQCQPKWWGCSWNLRLSETNLIIRDQAVLGLSNHFTSLSLKVAAFLVAP